MYRSLIALAGSLLFMGQSFGQDRARGRVVSDSLGTLSGIPDIEIFIPATGETTRTDASGYFTFLVKGTGHMDIVARFSALDSNVFMYHPPHEVFPVLVKSMEQMRDIRIRVGKAASQINSRGIQKVETLNEGEFKKAACCTLSESFETNNTVEVSNADGVSGIRQVEMLGLSGKYVLMTRDNMPLIRGLNVLTGLNQIPGPMVGGVHIAKGAGSVTNGYEGVTGGLNYALKSEHNDPRLFLNGYANGQSRFEGNMILRQKVTKKVYNHAYLHYGTQLLAFDRGNDGFSDLPPYKMIYVGDQLNYFGSKSEGMFGVSYVNETREGGDIHIFRNPDPNATRFHFKMDEQRAEAFAKVGIFLNEDASKSIGNIFYVTNTKTDAVLNNLRGRTYSGNQQTISYTGLYGSPDEKKWSVKTGINVVYDNVAETYKDSWAIKYQPDRQEFSAGTFGELVLKTDIVTAVIGSRVDWNNLYGVLLTPRFHLKYDITKQQQIHLQAGLGRRTPWVFADNLPLLISSRELIINEENIPGQKGAYGMPQEQAWNGGISYTKHFMLFQFPSTLSVDAYYTWFAKQVVADRDADPGKLYIGSQAGNRTTMGQVDWNAKPHRRVEFKLSYRYVYSQMLLAGADRLQTMQAPHRGLVVVNYNTRSKWFFDAIAQFNSPKRLPITTILPKEKQMPSQSPWYTLLNFQVRKEIKQWEVYAGGENLLNTFQKNPVLNVTNNGTEYFDAAFAWGPTMGRNFFVGFRYSLK